MENSWIRGKTIVVCGAGNGLGKYLSYTLISEYNCQVKGIDIDEKSLINLNNLSKEIGDNFEYYAFDAKVENNWINFANVMNEKKITIDILINCIGQTPKFNNFNLYASKEINQIMATNLYSCIFATKALYENMKKSRCPSIINMCCSAVNTAVPGTSIYSASKSALKSYTEVLQQELDNFYVGLFILGIINTSFWKNQDEVLQKKIAKKAMSMQTACNKVIKCMCKKKKRAVIGFDAYVTDRLSRLMPYKAKGFFNKILNRHKVRIIDNN